MLRAARYARGVIARWISLVAVVAASLGACDLHHKDLSDATCKRLASCGETIKRGCCVDCNPSEQLSFTYACARKIVGAPTCNRALEIYNERECLERPR